MKNTLEMIIVVLVAAFAALGFVSTCSFCESVAYGNGGEDRVRAAIVQLQPATGDERADRLSVLFSEAGEDHGLDPLLLVALSMRESSLSPLVENREVFGSRGEIGLMQAHGVALRFRPQGCSSALESAWCQVQTGARFLSVVRESCRGSTWRWVGSYGASRCMTEDEARAHPSTRIAHRYYVQVGGTGWE